MNETIVVTSCMNWIHQWNKDELMNIILSKKRSLAHSSVHFNTMLDLNLSPISELKEADMTELVSCIVYTLEDRKIIDNTITLKDIILKLKQVKIETYYDVVAKRNLSHILHMYESDMTSNVHNALLHNGQSIDVYLHNIPFKYMFDVKNDPIFTNTCHPYSKRVEYKILKRIQHQLFQQNNQILPPDRLLIEHQLQEIDTLSTNTQWIFTSTEQEKTHDLLANIQYNAFLTYKKSYTLNETIEQTHLPLLNKLLSYNLDLSTPEKKSYKDLSELCIKRYKDEIVFTYVQLLLKNEHITNQEFKSRLEEDSIQLDTDHKEQQPTEQDIYNSIQLYQNEVLYTRDHKHYLLLKSFVEQEEFFKLPPISIHQSTKDKIHHLLTDSLKEQTLIHEQQTLLHSNNQNNNGINFIINHELYLLHRNLIQKLIAISSSSTFSSFLSRQDMNWKEKIVDLLNKSDQYNFIYLSKYIDNIQINTNEIDQNYKDLLLSYKTNLTILHDLYQKTLKDLHHNIKREYKKFTHITPSSLSSSYIIPTKWFKHEYLHQFIPFEHKHKEIKKYIPHTNHEYIKWNQVLSFILKLNEIYLVTTCLHSI